MNYEEEMIDEIVHDETPEFKISDSVMAEWALKKIAKARQNVSEMEYIINKVVTEYQIKLSKVKQQNDTSFLEQKLSEYFSTVEHKKTKTQETYQLPSGTLKYKYGTLDYKRDDAELITWLESNYPFWVKVKKDVEWGELKKTITVQGENALTEDGEIIPGITVIQKPNRFEVEV